MSEGPQRTFSQKQESVLFNPFTIHNNSPKWPDGLASYSISKKYTRVSEIRGKDHVIILFPGFVNWMCCYTEWFPDEETRITTPVKTQLQEYVNTANHGIYNFDEEEQPDATLIRIQNEVATITDPALQSGQITTNVRQLYDAQDIVCEWRPVSIGMRLYCANNDQQNHGYLECIRMPSTLLKENFGIIVNQDPILNYFCNPVVDFVTPLSPQLAQGYLALPQPEELVTGNNTKLQGLPSYSILPYKDVSDYQFLLNPSMNSNEFNTKHNLIFNEKATTEANNVLFKYDTTTDVYVAVTQTEFTPKIYDPKRNLHDPNNPTYPITHYDNIFLEEGFLTHSHDVIVIRLHGTYESRFVIHTCANYEYLSINDNKYPSTVTYTDHNLINRYIENRTTYHKLPYDNKGKYPDSKY